MITINKNKIKIFILYLVVTSLIIAYGISHLKNNGTKNYLENKSSKEHKSTNRLITKQKDPKNTNQSSVEYPHTMTLT